MDTRSRISPINDYSDDISSSALQDAWLSAMTLAFRSGRLPTRHHAWERVFRAMAEMGGPELRLLASHSTIASRSCTSPRTVILAIQAAAKIGLIRVTPRYGYDPKLGKRVKTSNAYRLLLDDPVYGP